MGKEDSECVTKTRQDRAIVLSSHRGMDEIALDSPTKLAELTNGEIKEYDISPDKFGIKFQNITLSLLIRQQKA